MLYSLVMIGVKLDATIGFFFFLGCRMFLGFLNVSSSLQVYTTLRYILVFVLYQGLRRMSMVSHGMAVKWTAFHMCSIFHKYVHGFGVLYSVVII